MSASEMDPEVRAASLMAWAIYSYDTKDPSVLQRLDRILRDKAEHWMVRVQAYRSILAVAGLPRSERPDTGHVDDIEKDVDWDLVARLVKG